jgi:HK97 gp10 family phage protein
MPIKTTFRMEGGPQIVAALRELGGPATVRVVRSALNRGATPIVRRAKQLAPQVGDPDDPYATGALRKAIAKRLRRSRRGATRHEVLIGVEKPRSRIAHLLEFGSAHQAAEPYLRPALDEQAGEVVQVIKRAMHTGIEREVRRLAQKTLRRR